MVRWTRAGTGSALLTPLLATALLTPGAGAQDASPTLSPAASLGPGLLGATTEVWRDDMSVPTTWTIASDDVGVTAYEDGQLAMSVTADSNTVWDDHQLDAAWPVLRVEAWIATTGNGMAGVACGSSLGVERYLWAGTDGAGGWLVGRMIDGRLQLIDRGDLPLAVDGRHVTMAIECAARPAEGGDNAVVTADGIPVATLFDIPVGPYDKATLLVGADTAPEEARFDDVVVHAGATYVAPEGDLMASPAP